MYFICLAGVAVERCGYEEKSATACRTIGEGLLGLGGAADADRRELTALTCRGDGENTCDGLREWAGAGGGDSAGTAEVVWIGLIVPDCEGDVVGACVDSATTLVDASGGGG